MNLYVEDFEHYAPKDSEYGFKKYFIAENDEEAYYKVYSYDPQYIEECVENMEEDENEDEVRERSKSEIISVKGELNLENLELHDLYYGRTIRGWKLIKENISNAEIGILEEVGVL